ncbi:HU family DNA-binding protein [Candidatus Sneabacter namystus]|uniref:HU family DNA-binding protein n=1 Tax=Candidatus Sneabacter namystus TaxID=2601646 RepID=A0A5C0ULH6_9RICK|nr:HU family DNA-binding protein [Candidatus Sneabacter namystus]QEK39734.1 HU family DNA-binding protein [Candidatus Sneabacter namystus]
MNKSEFISFIAEKKGMTRVESESALNAVIDSITSAIELGESVNLVGFGAWHVVDRDARMGHNPKTGEKMQIPAYSHPTFKAGQRLKDACNQGGGKNRKSVRKSK